MRLKDQFKQNLYSQLRGSSRFNHLLTFHDSFQRSRYLDTIEDPDTRLIFTRLRVDINILSTCKIHKQILNECPLCKREPETVKHFITKCSYFKDERNDFLQRINSYINKANWNDDKMLGFVLNLDCPPEFLGISCNYVRKIYDKRQSLN